MLAFVVKYLNIVTFSPKLKCLYSPCPFWENIRMGGRGWKKHCISPLPTAVSKYWRSVLHNESFFSLQLPQPCAAVGPSVSPKRVRPMETNGWEQRVLILQWERRSSAASVLPVWLAVEVGDSLATVSGTLRIYRLPLWGVLAICFPEPLFFRVSLDILHMPVRSRGRAERVWECRHGPWVPGERA